LVLLKGGIKGGGGPSPRLTYQEVPEGSKNTKGRALRKKGRGFESKLSGQSNEVRGTKRGLYTHSAYL